MVYSELEHGPQFRANRWLDLDRDGVITRDELTDALVNVAVPRTRGRHALALEGLAAVMGEAETKPARTYAANAQHAVVVTLRRPGGDPPPDAA